VMMVLIIYIFAILIASSAGTWLEAKLDPHSEGLHWLSLASQSADAHVFEVARRFGTLTRSSNTLLQIMLGGSDWGDIVDMSMATGALIPFLLYLFVSFTMLAVLNVVTGVFVDNALENTKKQQQYQIDKAKEAEQDMMKQLGFFFSALDADGSGYLTKDELVALMENQLLKAVFNVWGFRVADIMKFFSLLDLDDDGHITFEEFSEAMDRLRGPARSLDLHLLLAETRAQLGKVR